MLAPLIKSHTTLKLFCSKVAAGFPSPADDYVEKGLSLDELLIQHPSATYLARANGNSMVGAGIFDNDILIVDKAIAPQHGSIVVVAINGELTCKYLNTKLKELRPANPRYAPIKITDESDMIIEGVVTASIRNHT